MHVTVFMPQSFIIFLKSFKILCFPKGYIQNLRHSIFARLFKYNPTGTQDSILSNNCSIILQEHKTLFFYSLNKIIIAITTDHK